MYLNLGGHQVVELVNFLLLELKTEDHRNVSVLAKLKPQQWKNSKKQYVFLASIINLAPMA